MYTVISVERKSLTQVVECFWLCIYILLKNVSFDEFLFSTIKSRVKFIVAKVYFHWNNVYFTKIVVITNLDYDLFVYLF